MAMISTLADYPCFLNKESLKGQTDYTLRDDGMECEVTIPGTDGPYPVSVVSHNHVAETVTFFHLEEEPIAVPDTTGFCLRFFRRRVLATL